MKREVKKTFTYAIEPSIQAKAMKKCKKGGSSLSEMIRDFVKTLAAPKKRTKGGIDLPADYVSVNKIGIDIQHKSK